ncbi:MAG: NUDIX domain-containing protein [Verrucomicrobia bacterium]|nr:NUDIX domain-containing protein [Verrucomicrobiota bacterium]
MATPRYRANVAAILRRADGKILIGERADVRGAWQFPQGGVKHSETLPEALHRELKEEISLSPKNYRVIESKGPYRYLFPPGRTKEGFDGQEQTYFLVEFTGAASNIDVDTETPELVQFRWISPNEFNIGWVPDFKRDVYRQVFADFFGVILGGIAHKS